MVNQCDGCARGLPITAGIHHGSTTYDAMACTADRYDLDSAPIHGGDAPGAAYNGSRCRVNPDGREIPASTAGRSAWARYHLTEGLLAGFPWCCVLFFTFVWQPFGWCGWSTRSGSGWRAPWFLWNVYAHGDRISCWWCSRG